MDIGAVSGSSKLLEALEKLGISEGAGLVSSGPSPVPPELARAFEQLMQEPDPSSQLSAPGSDAPPPSTPQVQEAPPLEDTQFSGQDMRVETQDAPSDVSFQPEGTAPLMSHTELYHLQFQLAMLKVQSTTGSQVSQKAAQGMDSLLRNQS